MTVEFALLSELSREKVYSHFQVDVCVCVWFG